MENFVNLINEIKEYSDKVYPDYDRNTVLVELPKKYYQDILLKLTKPNIDLLFKSEKNKNDYILVFGLIDILNDDEVDD